MTAAAPQAIPTLTLDPTNTPTDASTRGGATLHGPDGQTRALHPVWLRERIGGADLVDADNHQRLYEPPELPADLHVLGIDRAGPDTAVLRFSDGSAGPLSLTALGQELGWLPDPAAPPAAQPWVAADAPRPEADWAALDDPAALRDLLAGFYRFGFCLLHGTPAEPCSLPAIARRFGQVRDTNFGPIFDVVTKPNPEDLAYTGLPLSGHTDNPYRRPIPGIQLLHCLRNTVAGGLSTVVDGFAIARTIRQELPEAYAALTGLSVRFRFESTNAVLESHGPLIELGPDGAPACIRFSTRVDYVPAVDPALLDAYYAGRRRFFELAADPTYQLARAFAPGMLLMVNNTRVLHGRTGFDHAAGDRHLQGCYIDHDGPDSLYRVLARDGRAPAARAA